MVKKRSLSNVRFCIQGFLAIDSNRSALDPKGGLNFCIGMLIRFAGTDGTGGLAKHTIYKLLNLDVAAKRFIRTNLPIMFSPFLLVLLCFFRRTFSYMKKYWWVSLFAVITIIQPLLSFEFTEIFDAQRLIMMGGWPFFLLAGLLLRDILESRWVTWVYFVLPFFYGTKHLNILEHAYPSLVGHRIIMNGIILALIFLETHYRKNGLRRTILNI